MSRKATSKEKRIAVEMWEEIKKKVEAGDKFNVGKFKEQFCNDKHINWYGACLLCEINNWCHNVCQLEHCSDGSIYQEVYNYALKPESHDKQKALEACKEILEIMKSIEIGDDNEENRDDRR